LFRNSDVHSFIVGLGQLGQRYKLIEAWHELSRPPSEKEYYIDLLLFHRKLKRFVALELKIGEFKPEYKGKMEFYLTVLNEQYKENDENDAIGIIVCKSKDKTIVEYSLKTSTQPIGVATYSTSPSLPEEYRQYLPAPEVIADKLAIVKDLFNDKDEK